MPYIRIEIVEDGTTEEQKARLIRGATELIVDVLGRDPQGTYVVIDEIPQENWGIGYQSIAARRRAATLASSETATQKSH
jgi:4-oxalocrotonate tautomerase